MPSYTYADMPPTARVWVYQSNRVLNDDECRAVEKIVQKFAQDWTAHGIPLKAAACVRYHAFIILIVDESIQKASGCSIDSSVRCLKEIEHKYGINLFNRLLIAYKEVSTNKVAIISNNYFKQLLLANTLTASNIVFNNMIQTMHDLRYNWEVPIAQSWHKCYLVKKNAH